MLLKKQNGKRDVITKNFMQKVLLGKETFTNSKLIAKNFNNFLTEIGPKLASEIEKPVKTFYVYLKKVDILQPEHPLSIKELKDAFFSLQTNKSPGHDIIKSCFRSLSKPLLHIFALSLEEGIFPDDLKIAKVTTIFKAGSIVYQITIYFIKNSLIFSKVTQRNMLQCN